VKSADFAYCGLPAAVENTPSRKTLRPAGPFAAKPQIQAEKDKNSGLLPPRAQLRDSIIGNVVLIGRLHRPNQTNLRFFP
jgi:hypothetical protein